MMETAEQKQKYVCDFFEEDVVYRDGRRNLEYGVVLESCENASSDEEDDFDFLTASKRIKPGEAKVAWYPKGNPEVVTEKGVSQRPNVFI